jgi:hypothetical protein
MSLKENVDLIKDGISTEEKFFESFFKVEKFWKKYKTAIIGIGVIIVISLFGLQIKNYIVTKNNMEANNAFNTLLENPNNAKAKAILKDKNLKLLQLAQYINSAKTDKSVNIDIKYIKELAQYSVALENNDIAKIEKLRLNQDFLLEDYATFELALIQALNKEYSKAKNTLKTISDNSPVAQLSAKLQHFLLSK